MLDHDRFCAVAVIVLGALLAALLFSGIRCECSYSSRPNVTQPEPQP